MRFTATIITSVAFSLLAEEPPSKEAKLDGGQTNQDAEQVFYDLKGELKWQLGGHLVTVNVDGANVDFTCPTKGGLIYRITAPRHLEGMVSSEDGSILMLLTTKSDRDAPFYDALVRLTVNGKGNVESTYVLPGAAKGFNDSGRWVEAIGAVSNDGRFVLVNMSRPHKHNENKTSFFYDWELWDTKTVKMVRRGLLVSDAQPNGEPNGAGNGGNAPARTQPNGPAAPGL